MPRSEPHVERAAKALLDATRERFIEKTDLIWAEKAVRRILRAAGRGGKVIWSGVWEGRRHITLDAGPARKAKRG